MATPRATATVRPPPPTPVATPTPVVDAFLGQLDAAWAQGDWPKALSLLDRIEQLAHSALDFRVSVARPMSPQARTCWPREVQRRRSVSSPRQWTSIQTVVRPEPRWSRSHRRQRQHLRCRQQTSPTSIRRRRAGRRGWILVEVLRRAGRTVHARHQTLVPDAHGHRVARPCGPFYCVLDSGLYLDARYLQAIRQGDGDYPVAYAVAHEAVQVCASRRIERSGDPNGRTGESPPNGDPTSDRW
jgi:Putative neutral zinc metallopeptidase